MKTFSFMDIILSSTNTAVKGVSPTQLLRSSPNFQPAWQLHWTWPSALMVHWCSQPPFLSLQCVTSVQVKKNSLWIYVCIKSSKVSHLFDPFFFLSSNRAVWYCYVWLETVQNKIRPSQTYWCRWGCLCRAAEEEGSGMCVLLESCCRCECSRHSWVYIHQCLYKRIEFFGHIIFKVQNFKCALWIFAYLHLIFFLFAFDICIYSAKIPRKWEWYNKSILISVYKWLYHPI